MIGAGFLVAHPQRILGIEVRHAMVFDINLRHAVVGRGQEIAIIEADFQRPRFEVVVPIRPALVRPIPNAICR